MSTAACAHRDVWLDQVPEDGYDDPSISSTIGDVPVRVYYEASRSGACTVLRIEDQGGNDLPVSALRDGVISRLARECERDLML